MHRCSKVSETLQISYGTAAGASKIDIEVVAAEKGSSFKRTFLGGQPTPYSGRHLGLVGGLQGYDVVVSGGLVVSFMKTLLGSAADDPDTARVVLSTKTLMHTVSAQVLAGGGYELSEIRQSMRGYGAGSSEGASPHQGQGQRGRLFPVSTMEGRAARQARQELYSHLKAKKISRCPF